MNWEYSVYETLDAVVEHNGIQAIVSPAYRGWDWLVRPTSARCEYPEVFTCGATSNRTKAIEAAEKALREADEHYPNSVSTHDATTIYHLSWRSS